MGFIEVNCSHLEFFNLKQNSESHIKIKIK